MKQEIRRICVFCGSRSGTRPEYGAAAAECGALLARLGIGVVYGGGNIGLMGQVADAALAGGGEVIGVIPARLAERGVGHDGVTSLVVVETMHERKRRMAELADGFLSLPGGIGTMEEFFEVFTWLQVGFHDKPVALLNVAGFYDPLLTWLDSLCQEGFLDELQVRTLLVGRELPALVERMRRWEPGRGAGRLERLIGG